MGGAKPVAKAKEAPPQEVSLGILSAKLALGVISGYTWSKTYTAINWNDRTISGVDMADLAWIAGYSVISIISLQLSILKPSEDSRNYSMLVTSAMFAGMLLDSRDLAQRYPTHWSVIRVVLPVLGVGALAKFLWDNRV